MSPESVSAFEPQPSGMSEMSRLSGVFFEPKKAFEDVAARPAFWVPLILTILVGVVFSALLGQHVGWSEVVRQQQQMNPKQAERVAQLPADQRDRAAALTTTITQISSYAGSVLGRPIGYLIVAAVLLGIVRGIMSAPIKFKQVFAILCYASLPGILQTVLKTVVMFLKKPEDFNIVNPLAFNPAAFMDFTTSSKFVYTIAASLDVFAIWTIVLVAIGLKAAGGKKLSFGGALTAVVLPWAVLVLIGASLAGLFS
ncbi:MAG: YIP1 family protein [Acidobacteriia bacterium]|nr:YIP1 family protein [Terriglobia bacterium]